MNMFQIDLMHLLLLLLLLLFLELLLLLLLATNLAHSRFQFLLLFFSIAFSIST